MKKFTSIMVTLTIITSLIFTSFAVGTPDESTKSVYDPSSILIIIKADADIDDVFGYMDFGKKNEAYISSTVRGIPMTVTVPTDEDYGKINEFYKISLTKEGEAKLDELIAELEKNPYIKAVSKNYYGELYDSPYESYFKYLLTESTVILKSSSTLNELKEGKVSERFFEREMPLDKNEWNSFKAALYEGRVQAAVKGEETDADTLLPTGAVLSYEKDGQKKEYTVILLGDINCDGKVTAADARLVLRHVAKLEEIDELYPYTAANLNKFDRLDSKDARSILRIVAKIGVEHDYVWELALITYSWNYCPSVRVSVSDAYKSKVENMTSLDYIESVEADEGSGSYNVNLKAPYLDNLMRLRFECRDIPGIKIEEKGNYGFLFG